MKKPQSLLATIAAAVLLVVPQASAAVILIEEKFGGLSSSDLNSTSADTFHSGITSAGGSATWVAATTFKADGSVTGSSDSRRSAYLNLGSYINAAKGTSTGLFTMQVTLAKPDGTTNTHWITAGFAWQNNPNTGAWFNGTTTAEGSTAGVATMMYRANGDIDQYGGLATSNEVLANDTVFSGTRTLTITLDLTQAGGYNGTNNFGKVTFGANTGAGNTYQQYGSYTYTSNTNFGSLLLSMNNSTVGSGYDSLTLTQIPEPGAALLGGLGLLALLRRRR